MFRWNSIPVLFIFISFDKMFKFHYVQMELREGMEETAKKIRFKFHYVQMELYYKIASIITVCNSLNSTMFRWNFKFAFNLEANKFKFHYVQMEQ